MNPELIKAVEFIVLSIGAMYGAGQVIIAWINRNKLDSSGS